LPVMLHRCASCTAALQLQCWLKALDSKPKLL
jgi:hypothetical protein